MFSFIHDLPQQRVVYACGAVTRIGDETKRLGLERALVVATPGSGIRIGGKVRGLLGARAVDLHAKAVVHVPRAIADEGIATARAAGADGLIAVGGGSAIGLAKAIAHELALPIVAIPTTFSGSEATPIFGMTDGG